MMQLSVRMRDLESALRKAESRYRGTAEALTTFSVELKSVQDEATPAIAAEATAVESLDAAEVSRDALKNAFNTAMAGGAPEVVVSGLHDRYDEQRRLVARFEREAGEATAAYRAAVDRWETAAAVAITAIDVALDETNDSFWDGVGGLFGDIFGAIGAALTWIADILGEALEFLAEWVMVAVIFVVIVLLIVALPGVGLALAVVLAAIFVGALLVVSVSQDIGDPLRGTAYPEQTRTADPDGTPETEATQPSYASVFDKDLVDVDTASHRTPKFDVDGDGILDSTGEVRDDMATMIQVVALRDTDTGEVVGWRVAIPSTQDWNPWSTSLNGLATNVVHTLLPGVDTQMERAVKDAMERAGVFESVAPVMLTGWSQGGITAAEVALDGQLAGREVSIVAGSSPMDQYRAEFAELDVRVTSVTHTDVVSGAEGSRMGLDDMVAHDPDFRQQMAIGAHSASACASSAAALFPEFDPRDDVFFADFEEGVVEEVHRYDYFRPGFLSVESFEDSPV